MATTFDVFFLGTFASIDPTEGNLDAENASVLVGETIGGPGTPLYDNIQTFSPGTTGFAGGFNSGAYEQDNNASNDTFSINGGGDQTFDALAPNNITLTHSDGTTATIAGVIFQDAAGNTCLAPGREHEADQATYWRSGRSARSKMRIPETRFLGFVPSTINQSILRIDRVLALRTAAVMEVSA